MPKHNFKSKLDKMLTKEERINHALRELSQHHHSKESKMERSQAFEALSKDLGLSSEQIKKIRPKEKDDINKKELQMVVKQYYVEQFEKGKHTLKDGALFTTPIDTPQTIKGAEKEYTASKLVDFAWHTYNKYKDSEDDHQRGMAMNARTYLCKRLLQDKSDNFKALDQFLGKAENTDKTLTTQNALLQQIMHLKEKSSDPESVPTLTHLKNIEDTLQPVKSPQKKSNSKPTLKQLAESTKEVREKAEATSQAAQHKASDKTENKSKSSASTADKLVDKADKAAANVEKKIESVATNLEKAAKKAEKKVNSAASNVDKAADEVKERVEAAAANATKPEEKSEKQTEPLAPKAQKTSQQRKEEEFQKVVAGAVQSANTLEQGLNKLEEKTNTFYDDTGKKAGQAEKSLGSVLKSIFKWISNKFKEAVNWFKGNRGADKEQVKTEDNSPKPK